MAKVFGFSPSNDTLKALGAKRVRTCKVFCEVKIGDRSVSKRTWLAVDIMKTSVTRGWATRQFNLAIKDAKRDEIVTVEWDAHYGEPDHSYIHGRMSYCNGHTYRRGVFEP